MSYDQANGFVTEYVTIPSSAFGAATSNHGVKGPKGKRGIVRDIIVDLTAAAVGTTTVPEVKVGASNGANEYARFRLGTSATAGYAAETYRARALVTGNPVPPTLSDFAGHVALETADIPADTRAVISLTAGVGGTPAGTGRVTVIIDWV